MKVAFIGLGNMGASLAKAVAKEVVSTDLLLVNRSPQKVEEFISQYGGTESHLEQVFQEAEVIFLGVKPYQICPLLEEYQQVAQVKQLLAGAGALFEIEEKLMDPATAVAGCGPAFVYQMIEAMADVGVALGLPREQALQMAAQTFKGAASMVIETGQHPGSLKDAVCSPGGSTIAGVNRLEQVGLRGNIIAGVKAAYKRTQEMGQEAGKK